MASSLALSSHRSRLNAAICLSDLLQGKHGDFKELKDHLNVDTSSLEPSQLETFVQDVVSIGEHAPLDHPIKPEFFRALIQTRFVSRSGALVMYTRSLVEKACASARSGQALPELVSSEFESVLNFLLSASRLCRSAMPELLEELREDLFSLVTENVPGLKLSVASFLFSVAAQTLPSVQEKKACDVDWRHLDILPMDSEVAEVRRLQKDHHHVRIPCGTLPEYIRVEKTYPSIDSYMDVYIRLFREDCFGKILHDISCTRDKITRGSGSRIFTRLSVVGVKFLHHPPGVALAVKCFSHR